MSRRVLNTAEAASYLGFKTLSAFHAARRSGRLAINTLPYGRGLYDLKQLDDALDDMTGCKRQSSWSDTLMNRLDGLHA